MMLSYCLTARLHMHTHNKLSNDWAWVCLCIHRTSNYEWRPLTNVHPPWQSTSWSAKCPPSHKRYIALIATSWRAIVAGFQTITALHGTICYTKVVTGYDTVWQCVMSSNKLYCKITLKLLHYLNALTEYVVEGSQHCILNTHTHFRQPPTK